MASTYRGKYPSRIRSIGALTGQPGLMLLETNAGEKFTITALAMRASNVSESLLKCGTDLSALKVAVPFDAPKARAIAAIHRARAGSHPYALRADLVDAIRTPAVLADAAMTHARSNSSVSALSGVSKDAAEKAYRDHADVSLVFLAHDAREDGNARLATLCDRARVHLSPTFAKLREAYRLQRAHKLTHRDDSARTASTALSFAREDIRRGWTRGPSKAGLLTHGSVIRTRKPDGSRVTFVVAHCRDETMGAPWEEHDGHGIIREVSGGRFGAYLHTAPGERLFSSDERHATVYAYDIAATSRLARQDGWGLSDENHAKLALKLGRTPTARQIAAAAVAADFERMRGWVRDDWEWRSVDLIEMPRDRDGSNYLEASQTADDWAYQVNDMPGRLAASLCGIEGDSGDGYFDEVARELLHEARA